MKDIYNLDRFISAQKDSYSIAFAEISRGRKTSHWMWFIFPQIAGLGFSETARFYAISDINEAREYLNHPTLGSRLIEICNKLSEIRNTPAINIFGTTDAMKLHSCLTLFALVPGANLVFSNLLDKYFNGEKDAATLRLIG